MQSQTHTFMINGSPMPCLQAGSGEPLLLIHGALANHTLWLEHIEQLSQHYTVYAPTLRHFGEAGKEGPFGLETHAGDLLTLLAQLACGPVHLVGWSYGADVALTAALQAPERVRSLYLVEPGCPGALDEQGLAAFMADAGAMFGPVFGQVEAGQQQEAVATLIDGSGGPPGLFCRTTPQVAAGPTGGGRKPAQATEPERAAGLVALAPCRAQRAHLHRAGRTDQSIVCASVRGPWQRHSRLPVPAGGGCWPSLPHRAARAVCKAVAALARRARVGRDPCRPACSAHSRAADYASLSAIKKPRIAGLFVIGSSQLS